MSVYPLMLTGSELSAVVAGGGVVAARKIRALVDAGATVHVVAPEVRDEVRAIAEASSSVRIMQTAFADEHFGNALLVVVATDDDAVNEQIAARARARGLLVNVASRPEAGNCVTPAVHRADGVVVAVTADGVPAAAARIRDRIARMIDRRYATAVRCLATLRSAMFDRGDRELWRKASTGLIGDDFCAQVESGAFDATVAEWR